MSPLGGAPVSKDARTLQTILAPEHRLQRACIATDTSFVANSIPKGSIENGLWAVIDPYTTECEVRKVESTTAGNIVGFTTALAYSHGAGDAVIWVNDGTVAAEWFGAVADSDFDTATSGTDNSTPLARMLVQAGIANGVRKCILGDGDYLFTTGISWNPLKIDLVGQNQTRLWYNNTTGTAITLVGDGQRAVEGLRSIRLVGDGKAYSTTGIQLNEIGATAYYMAHAAIKNVRVDGFETGLNYGSKAWGNVFDNFYVSQCATALYVDSTATGMGERIEFTNSMFTNNDLAIDVQYASVALFFQNCSFDYNVQVASFIGSMMFHECHIEFQGTHATYPASDYQFIAGDSGAFASFKQCRFVMTNVLKEVFKPYQGRYSSDYFKFDDCKLYTVFDASYASGRSNPYYRLVANYIDPEFRNRGVFDKNIVSGTSRAAFGLTRVPRGTLLTSNDNLPTIQVVDYPGTYVRTSTNGSGSTSGAVDVLDTVAFNTFSAAGVDVHISMAIPTCSSDWGKRLFADILVQCSQDKTLTFRWKFYKKAGPYRFQDTFNTTTGVTITLPKAVQTARSYIATIVPTASTDIANLGTVYITHGTGSINVYNTGSSTTTPFYLIIHYLYETGYDLLFQSSTVTSEGVTAGNAEVINHSDSNSGVVPNGCDYAVLSMTLPDVDGSTDITITHPWIVAT